jgi:hypothetical protein
MQNERDLVAYLKAQRDIEPRVIMAGNATYTGQTIDRQHFGNSTHVIITGTLTDALYTCNLYESDDSGMSGETKVANADLLGQTQDFVITGTAGVDSNKAVLVGYKGTKRYHRLKIVQSGATTGGYIASACIQSSPDYAPVAGATLGS